MKNAVPSVYMSVLAILSLRSVLLVPTPCTGITPAAPVALQFRASRLRDRPGIVEDTLRRDVGGIRPRPAHRG